MSEAQIFKKCHDEPEKLKIKCPRFRQAIAKLISTDDSNLLDAIERLHIECKSCEIPSDARNESQGKFQSINFSNVSLTVLYYFLEGYMIRLFSVLAILITHAKFH